MSAGTFLDAFYETNGGGIAPIRIQPETAALVFGAATNAVPAGPATIPVSAKVSASRRSIGIKPRTVTVEFVGGAPDGYEEGGTITLPWLQSASWELLTRGATGTYLATSVRLVGKSPENIR